jgi:AAA+ ATPase superfamily predicted ATPase
MNGDPMIKNPFVFSEPALGDYFCDRYREREILLAELAVGRNIVLGGQKQGGKTSLARRILYELERKGFLALYVDFQFAYSPLRLVETYLRELIRTAFRQTKDLKSFIDFLPAELTQQFAFEILEHEELVFHGLDEKNIEDCLEPIFSLTLYAAAYKKRGAVVCFDGVDEAGHFSEASRKLFWDVSQLQPETGYLYLAKEKPVKKKLHNFTEIHLAKLEDRYLRAYIKTRFENSGFQITEEGLDQVLSIASRKPNSVQMLCHHLWNLGLQEKSLLPQHIHQAVEHVLETQNAFYSWVWRALSMHQKNFLLALVQGGGQKIFSQEFVQTYGLGNFSTVQKSLNRLLEENILEREEETVVVRDPFFKRWIQKNLYF